MLAEKKSCCCGEGKRQTLRDIEEKKALLNRLNRASGQINGLKRMLEEDAYCSDILTQVVAVNAALNSFSKLIIAHHLTHCVADDLKAGDTSSTQELVHILQKLL